ncbi:MAG: nickel pincer cofactor biosynthesis protein LarC [Chloroflexi bacterium]|nr:nickel pincer cofactor biosynthesis protein LarC [Chloroflexota bacterium]
MRSSGSGSSARTDRTSLAGGFGASRIAYFDCFSGASGDMVLGALIDAGLEPASLESDLQKLPFSGWKLDVARSTRAGLAGTQVKVSVEHPDPGHRTLKDVTEILESSGLPASVRARALSIFGRLAEAEGRVHGVSAHDVQFHDVGAIDAIVDVVGAAIALDALGIDQCFASPLPLGHGAVQSAHGVLPLPAPATLALIASVAAPTRPMATEFELVTPTGAAILTTVASFSQPPMTIDAVGVGLGARDLAWPNVLRLWVGAPTATDLYTGEITVIETNLDDSSPEQLAFAMERFFDAGALDVFFTPAQMKKNRPGVVLTILANPAQADRLARAVLRETSSLGVRFRSAQRLMTPRRNASVETAFGLIQVKIKTIDGEDVLAPEYEDCARVARDRGVPIAAVYAAALRAGL